jgi:hypothetical protein
MAWRTVVDALRGLAVFALGLPTAFLVVVAAFLVTALGFSAFSAFSVFLVVVAVAFLGLAAVVLFCLSH